MRLRRQVPVAALILGLLTGCSSGAMSTDSPPASVTPVAHIHGLAFADDGALLVATHEGVFSQRAGNLTLLTEPPFDAMGFQQADGTMWASGHPGTESPSHFAFPNIGLMRSDDGGANWTPVALTGEVDFHSMALGLVAGELLVYGVSSDGAGVSIGSNEGRDWTIGAQLAARDLALDTRDGALWATTAEGLVISTDRAATFSPVSNAPKLVLLEIVDGIFTGVDADGMVWQRTDDDGDWAQGGMTPGPVVAMAVQPERGIVVAHEDASILESADLGHTWVRTPRS